MADCSLLTRGASLPARRSELQYIFGSMSFFVTYSVKRLYWIVVEKPVSNDAHSGPFREIPMETARFIKIPLSSYSMESYSSYSKGREWNRYQRYSEVDSEGKPHSHLDLSPELLTSAIRQDLETLKAYTHVTYPKIEGTLADKVFGQQVEVQKASGHHLSNLLSERWRLYRDHIGELRDEISRLKNRLYLASRPYVIDHPMRQANLERNLLKLESDARKEEIDFWKDSMEIRDKLLDVAHEYRKGVTRSRLFGRGEEQSG